MRINIHIELDALLPQQKWGNEKKTGKRNDQK